MSPQDTLWSNPLDWNHLGYISNLNLLYINEDLKQYSHSRPFKSTKLGQRRRRFYLFYSLGSIHLLLIHLVTLDPDCYLASRGEGWGVFRRGVSWHRMSTRGPYGSCNVSPSWGICEQFNLFIKTFIFFSVYFNYIFVNVDRKRFYDQRFSESYLNRRYISRRMCIEVSEVPLNNTLYTTVLNKDLGVSPWCLTSWSVNRSLCPHSKSSIRLC